MANPINPPEILWKYRRWNQHTIASIQNGELYFAPIPTLNDPFEFRWRHRFPRDPDEIDRIARELCAQEFPFHRTPEERAPVFNKIKADITAASAMSTDGTALSEVVSTYGLYCLSEVYDNILMWSHYADEHKGVCLGIRTSALEIHQLYPVQYTDSVPVIDISEFVAFTPATFNNMALAKATDWSYEKEWRTGHRPGAHYYERCVDRVIIGAKASTQTRDAVLAATKLAPHAISVFEARLSEQRYALEIEPIE